MLRCLCGKRSSDTYVVNKGTRQNGVAQQTDVVGRITQSLNSNELETLQQNNNKITQRLINNEKQTPATQDNTQQNNNSPEAQNNKNQINNSVTQVTKSKIIQNGQIPTVVDEQNEVESSRITNIDQIQKAEKSPAAPDRGKAHERNETPIVETQITRDPTKSSQISLVNEEIKPIDTAQISSVKEETKAVDTSQTSQSSQIPTNETNHAENIEIENLDNVTTNKESSVKSKAPQPPQRKLEEANVQLKPEPIPVAIEDSAAETSFQSDEQKETIEDRGSIDVSSKPKPSPVSVAVEDSAAKTASHSETIEESVPIADVHSKPKSPQISTAVEDRVAETSSHREQQKETVEESVSIADIRSKPKPPPLPVAVEDSAAETASHSETIEESVPIADVQSKLKSSPISVVVEDSVAETSSHDQKQNEKIEESILVPDVQSKPKPPPISVAVEDTAAETSSHSEKQRERIEESVSITDVQTKPEPASLAVEDSVVGTSSHDVKQKETVKKSSTDKKKEEEDIGIATLRKRRSGVIPVPVNFDEDAQSKLKTHPKSREDAALIKEAIQRNDFLNKIINGRRLDDVVNAMYSKEIPTKTTIVKQGDKGTHMYISASGRFQVLIKNKAVSEFSDVRVFGELAILYNAKRLATIKALSLCRVWVLDYHVFQQIMVRHNIRRQDEIMEFLMNSEKLKVVGKEALMEVANLLKSEFFKPGTQIVRQGDKGNTFYIIRAGTVTITKDGEGVVGLYKKGDCFGELALLKEDCRQATVTADPPGVECLTLTRKEFVDHLGELRDWEYINIRPQDSFKDGVTEHGDIDLRDLKMIKTLGVGGFGRVELVQHKKKNDQVFALKYLKKIDIVTQHQQEHVYNEKNIQMACKSPFIVRLYRTYKDNKYIYLLMESCLGGDLWSLLQKQKLRRFEEKEARFIAGCVLEAFEYLHSRGIIYRDLKPENLLIAVSGYIKLTDFGFAKKISSRGKTFTFAGTPEYVAPEIVLNRGHDRSVDYWAFGAFIFELLTGRTPFRTDDSSHMKTYNKILSGIDNVTFPSYVNLKARHIVEKLCRPVPSERLGMQRGGIKDIKAHKWFLGFDWGRFANCDMPSPFRPKLKSQIDTQYFDQFKKDTDVPPDEISGWDSHF